MSGPKVLSFEVFNEKLKEIFRLQCRAEALMKELSQLEVKDEARGIGFDCSGYVRKNKKWAKELLATFNPKHRGNQKEVRYIGDKIKDLEAFIQEGQSEKENFNAKAADYKAYLSYEQYHDACMASFEAFKKDVCDFLVSGLQSGREETQSGAVKEISSISPAIETAPFAIGFSKKAASERKKVEEHIGGKESQVNAIRIKVSDRILAEAGAQDAPPASSRIDLTKLPGYRKKEKDIQQLISKINAFVGGIDDALTREKYLGDLKKLVQSRALKDAYFYTELLEDIKQKEKVRGWKIELKDALVRLNRCAAHADMDGAGKGLIRSVIALMDRDAFRAAEHEDLMGRCLAFESENRAKLEAKAVKERQAQFIKKLLIRELTELDYEVIEDMQVIDFEKDNDFVLKAPGQENYLNLRFNEDGSFMYNFIIPERKEELSVDQTRTKLAGMTSACADFKEALKELSDLGIRFSLDKELAASEKALIQVPEHLKPRIEKSRGKRKQGTAAEKKRMRLDGD